MITENLFERALLKPAMRSGARSLVIIAGYATPAMANHHIQHLDSLRLDSKVSIRLIVGMTSCDGIPSITHAGFRKLMSPVFECRYIVDGPPVHTKAYGWVDSHEAFVGSADYTQAAFHNVYREVLVESSPSDVDAYYNDLLLHTVPCNHPEIHRKVRIVNRGGWDDNAFTEDSFERCDAAGFSTNGLEHVKISLLGPNGEVPVRSGLNWGQRRGRDHNQAYIAIRRSECPIGFFPPQKRYITIMTDDGVLLEAHIAQQNGKAIHTIDNAQLGRYFRERIGVAYGAKVSKTHLSEYGRFTVDFYKIDDETFYMDFTSKTLKFKKL